MKKQLIKFDIIIVNGEVLQYLSDEMDMGIWVQDIHCKKDLTHVNCIQRKANKNEVKWFCENTENIDFITPNTVII
jgi:hypothetical protein